MASAGGSAVAQEGLSISGTVWEDLNANGVRDPEDPPIQVFIHLKTAAEGTRSMRRSDASGHYEFTNVQPGRHIIALESSQLLYWTYPARRGSGEYTIGVNVGSTSVTGIDFGVHLPEEHLTILARTWVYAMPDAGTNVRAFIGASDCTGPTRSLLPPGGGRTFFFSVISSDLDPACGDPGDTIRFEVDGLPANETAIWEDRNAPGVEPRIQSSSRLTLTVGPPFGYATLESTSPEGGEQFPIDGTVFGYVDGKPCASNLGTGFTSYLVIGSIEYPDGCGYEGATVEIVMEGAVVAKVEWASGNLGAIEVPWRPWPVDEDDEIRPPSVGDGGLL
jgi:hypothetical protein